MVAPSSFDTLPPDLAPCVYAQVAGLHRAVPSTALDKAIQLSEVIIARRGRLCQRVLEKSPQKLIGPPDPGGPYVSVTGPGSGSGSERG